MVTNDENLKKRIDFLRNFGFVNEVTVVAPGSNIRWIMLMINSMDRFVTPVAVLIRVLFFKEVTYYWH